MTGTALPYLRRARSQVAPLRLQPADLPASLDAAYAALAGDQCAAPELLGGWKLGGTNHASRAAFQVDRLYYGAIDRADIIDRPALAPGFALSELKGEVEIALRVDAGGQGFDAWCIALEMPSSPLEGLMDLGVVALVADRCAAGCLLLGPVQDGPLPGPAARFVQRINGVVQADSDQGSLVGTPAAILADFLAMAAGHGAPVRPGHWVATGGITPCLPYREGDRVEVLMDGQIVLDLAISCAKG
jgi:2-keto-4-pentenoate hydratase